MKRLEKGKRRLRMTTTKKKFKIKRKTNKRNKYTMKNLEKKKKKGELRGVRGTKGMTSQHSNTPSPKQRKNSIHLNPRQTEQIVMNILAGERAR